MSKTLKYRQGTGFAVSGMGTKRLKYRKNTEGFVKLLKCHNNRMRVLTQFYNEEALQYLSLMISKASADLYCHALLNSRASQYGQKIFDGYKDIIDAYKAALLFYKENMAEISEPEIKSVLDGIALILDSRISEYCAADPLEEEKIDILNIFLKKFFKDIEIQISRNFNGMLDQIEHTVSEIRGPADSRLFLEMGTKVRDMVIETFAAPLYGAVFHNITLAVGALDNFDNRKALIKLYSSMKQEYEILESLIKVQVVALEKSGSQSQGIVVQKILSVIREAYQHAGKNISSIDRLYQELSQIRPDIQENSGGFIDNMRSFIEDEVYYDNSHYDMLCDEYFYYDHVFASRLKDELDKAILTAFKAKPELQTESIAAESIDQNRQLLNHIIRSFQRIIQFTDEHKDAVLMAEAESNIIQGIRETIDIKLISLREAGAEFEHNMAELGKSSGRHMPDVSQIDKNNLAGQLYTGWLDAFSGIVEINSINAIKAKNNINGAIREIIARIFAAYDKSCARFLEQLSKMELAYRRDSLLFEISTFEEIMNYSVSKLREDSGGKDVVIQYIDMIEHVNTDIYHILHKTGITVIKPRPHDQFNGREHEVLMAEQREGFEKGQIIKVSNCGFKQNDTVIIRANVIAAR